MTTELPESPQLSATEKVRETVRASRALAQAVRDCCSKAGVPTEFVCVGDLLKYLQQQDDVDTFLHINEAMGRAPDGTSLSTFIGPAMKTLFDIWL